MLKRLKKEVLEANLDLVRYDLVTLTWGNVSGISRDDGLVVIKPSGVEYKKLRVQDMIVVDLNGKVVDGTGRPSSDTPTHLELYKGFPSIGGIAHTHSEYATTFAQACREIKCFGTTHADAFFGPVPVTRFLTKEEVEEAYELNTGKMIVEHFRTMDYEAVPAVLIAGHAPFTWGKDARDAVKNSLILERVASMAMRSNVINPDITPLPEYVLLKHHLRKHGPGAYYGQRAGGESKTRRAQHRTRKKS
ncbi:MAG TPA: L-ribulose-5-phosphate 4-epimerase [Bacteroidota bacterium]|nr:L-ribulose-5-phosphate 4-epimerase [Bacteroidota bacterium]